MRNKWTIKYSKWIHISIGSQQIASIIKLTIIIR